MCYGSDCTCAAGWIDTYTTVTYLLGHVSKPLVFDDVLAFPTRRYEYNSYYCGTSNII